MRDLIIAGVQIPVVETDWDITSKPAKLTIKAANDRVLLRRLTDALRTADVHQATAKGLSASVRVLSMTTDKHRITLQLAPVEIRSA
ncbi:hypothetical protein [Phenylobacterium deserti]|uniref:Uncharacterized protein n=1 Tax=Phenylobacterium deserti TaxID=1914756 RepID=A0A328A8V4_9CAUL|nr:hypothetical protein [Phenylobacterium deserti]RAK50991.1 hypothetical protein DJ018_17705 [Phenylobacterium deserti]